MKVIGIDLGKRKAAYAIWEDGALVLTGAREARPKHRALELEVIGEWMHEVVWEAALGRGLSKPYVFVEEPLVGRSVRASLEVAMTYGAVLAALADMHNERRIEIHGANVRHWKKGTIGNGNAGKDEVRNYITGINSSYPALCGHDQDRIDAACIGYYGVLTAARADDLSTMEDA